MQLNDNRCYRQVFITPHLAFFQGHRFPPICGAIPTFPGPEEAERDRWLDPVYETWRTRERLVNQPQLTWLMQSEKPKASASLVSDAASAPDRLRRKQCSPFPNFKWKLMYLSISFFSFLLFLFSLNKPGAAQIKSCLLKQCTLLLPVWSFYWHVSVMMPKTKAWEILTRAIVGQELPHTQDGSLKRSGIVLFIALSMKGYY